ncbi:MAG: hypothetical protein M5U12_04240 [Verrucomicrobia bacterium]|nr:hypothetical protein [Verrucomicrobiota bacterium]
MRQIQQRLAGAEEKRLDRPQRQPQHSRHLFVRFLFEIKQGHDAAVLLGQPGQQGLDIQFGSNLRTRRLQSRQRFPQPARLGSIQRDGGTTAAALELREARVARNRVQPGGQGRRALEAGQRLPHFQQDVLCHVFGGGFVAQHADGQPKHPLLVDLEQVLESLPVLPGRQSLADRVVHQDAAGRLGRNEGHRLPGRLAGSVSDVDSPTLVLETAPSPNEFQRVS